MSIYDSINAPPADRLPTSALPHMWFGYIFVVVFFLVEVVGVILVGMGRLEVESIGFRLPLILIGVGGWIYWLFCIYRVHKVLAEMSQDKYPNPPSQAVWGHIVPFYNLYWIFKWPADLAAYLFSRGGVKMASGSLLGVLLLIFILVARLFEASIGLAGLFGVGLYVNAKLQRYIESISAASPAAVPPPPAEQFFRKAGPPADAERHTNASPPADAEGSANASPPAEISLSGQAEQ